MVEVLLVEYNKRMLKYALKNPKYEDGKLKIEYLYPSAEYDSWVDWAQNINERYIMNDQRNIYSSKTQKI